MTTRKNVLIFPAGTEIAFEILNALKYSKFVTLYGATSADDHSAYTYKNLIKGLPFVGEDGFLDALNEVIKKHNIDCVYPAHDSASVFLSRHADEIGAQVIIADKTTTDICHSKGKTYKQFSGESFIPEVFSSNEVSRFPVFVKPDIGQGSNGAKLINSMEELDYVSARCENLLICEYLSGDEFTVDCFTDKDGRLRVALPRTRERTRNGISVRSTLLDKDERITKIAEIINSRLSFKGAWFFQLKKNAQGEYKLLEISPRIPGTMGLTRNLGINFPMLTLFTFWGFDVDIIENHYKIQVDRALYSAYRIDADYDHVYIDFDDTLIIDGKINTTLIGFLYDALNKGKHIHLLSRHSGDIFEDLKKSCISEDIFSTITVLGDGEEKTDFITESSAVFIDDSFAERIKVSREKGIPVFDVDMIEALTDYKY